MVAVNGVLMVLVCGRSYFIRSILLLNLFETIENCVESVDTSTPITA